MYTYECGSPQLNLGGVEVGVKLNRLRLETNYELYDMIPKRYRKPVTTGNTVISNGEKRNFRRSSDLA